MSFSSETKDELSCVEIKRKCCSRSALCALIHTCGSIKLQSELSVIIAAESSSLVRWSMALSKKNYELKSELRVREHRRLGKKLSYVVEFSGEEVERLLSDAGIMSHSPDGWQIRSEVNEPLTAKTCCKRSFLRGAFMGCGSVSNPEKGYHLEFALRSSYLMEPMLELLNGFDLRAKSVTRKGNDVVYLKESDKISEFLSLIGADEAILKMENWRALREFRNNVNRQVNCETANIQKTVTAATRQLDNIRYLVENGCMDSLSFELREAAKARVDYPDASLAELGEMLSIPIGKSGMNHRLRKLEDLAKSMRSINKKGDT